MDELIGEKIRRLRQQSAFSQGHLAKLSGTTQQQISLIEKGRAGLEFRTLQRILEALGQQVRIVPRVLGGAGEWSARKEGWERFAEYESALDAGSDAAGSLARIGELVDFYIARHGDGFDGPHDLKAMTQGIQEMRGMLSKARMAP